MATLATSYTFTNGTTADADQVEQNFTDIVDFINTNVIQADGSVAFTGVPEGPATDPTDANDLARKAYVDAQIIAGIAAGTGVFKKISTQTGSTISFTSIPATYEHLRIVGQVRGAAAVVSGDINIRMNNDTGTNYIDQGIQGSQAATPESKFAVSQTMGRVGYGAGASDTANLYTPIVIDIPNYRTSAMLRHAMGQTCYVGSISSIFRIFGVKWGSTTAISRLDLGFGDAAFGTFAAASSATLYGA